MSVRKGVGLGRRGTAEMGLQLRVCWSEGGRSGGRVSRSVLAWSEWGRRRRRVGIRLIKREDMHRGRGEFGWSG